MRYRDHSAMCMCLGAAKISKVRKYRAANCAALLGAGLLAVTALSGCDHQEVRLVLTKPAMRDMVVAHEYVCQIHSSRHIGISAPASGYLEVADAQEGRLLKKGDEMFKIMPQTPTAAVKRADGPGGFTSVKAPFNGRMNRLRMQSGSPVREGEVLTTLSDNSEMWVDFNVPEAHYREYCSATPTAEMMQVRLMLANGRMFDQAGRVNFIKAEVNPKTGTVPMRAVFPNPKDLLRNGGSGNIRLQSTIKNALLVPKQSTFVFTDHHCIYVVDKGHVIRRKQLTITQELKDFFLVTGGVSVDDTIIFKGVQQVHDDEKAGDSEFEEPAKAYAHLNFTDA